MTFNKVILIGRLTRDPETAFAQSGTQVTKFAIAVNRRQQNGRQGADFVPIVTFGKLAEVVSNHCTKGKLILVDGELNLDKYEKDGQTRTYTKVLAQRIQFLEYKEGHKDERKDDEREENTNDERAERNDAPEFFSADDDPTSDDVPF